MSKMSNLAIEVERGDKCEFCNEQEVSMVIKHKNEIYHICLDCSRAVDKNLAKKRSANAN